MSDKIDGRTNRTGRTDRNDTTEKRGSANRKDRMTSETREAGQTRQTGMTRQPREAGQMQGKNRKTVTRQTGRTLSISPVPCLKLRKSNR